MSNKVLHRPDRGRPLGAVRQALQEAAQQLHAEQGGANWRQMAQRACVGFGSAKVTVRDMVRAGELRPDGQERVPHARRPMVRYVPGGSWQSQPQAAGLLGVMRLWR